MDTSNFLQFLSPSATQLGISGITGFILGYLLKKTLKLLIVIGALITAFMLFVLYELQKAGAITLTVDYSKLPTISNDLLTWGTVTFGSLLAFMSSLTLVSTGLIGGAALGFSKG